VVPSLEGKRAIVTGASSGIGAATVRALREEGMRVAGGARRADRIDSDVALELDVTDRVSCEGFVTEAVEQLGGLDVLVNGAGLALGREPFWESKEEDERVVLETNVHGLIRMTRLCLPFLLEGVGGDRGLNQPDQIHPTAVGQKIIAETVWKSLQPLLQTK